MDKSTLSNYGWIVIVTLVLAVMLALATPFGTFVGKGASNVIKTFVQSSDNAVDEDNIDTQGEYWDGYLNDGSGDVFIEVNPDENQAIVQMQPMATEIHPAMKEAVTAAVTPNYIYAKQAEATTIEEAFVSKKGVTYEGTKKSTYWATGDLIKVYKDGELLGDYYVVVLGDLDGDGVISVIDASLAERTLSGHYDPTGAFMMAADIDCNGSYTKADDYQGIINLALGEDEEYKEAFVKVMGIETINVSFNIGIGTMQYSIHNIPPYAFTSDKTLVWREDNSLYVETAQLDGTYTIPEHTKFSLAWIDGSFSHWVNQKTGKTYSGTVSAYDMLVENDYDNNIILEAQWKQEWF